MLLSCLFFLIFHLFFLVRELGNAAYDKQYILLWIILQGCCRFGFEMCWLILFLEVCTLILVVCLLCNNVFISASLFPGGQNLIHYGTTLLLEDSTMVKGMCDHKLVVCGSSQCRASCYMNCHTWKDSKGGPYNTWQYSEKIMAKVVASDKSLLEFTNKSCHCRWDLRDSH